MLIVKLFLELKNWRTVVLPVNVIFADHACATQMPTVAHPVKEKDRNVRSLPDMQKNVAGKVSTIVLLKIHKAKKFSVAF